MLASDNRRLVVVLQFWEGDKAAAMRNARRIADNEPKFRDDFEIMFASRFDCQQDQETIQYVSKKFKTSIFKSPRRATGWPHGCNDLLFSIAQESFQRVTKGPWANVRAMYLMEADCIPVHREWLDRLKHEWELTEQSGKWIAGWWAANGNDAIGPDGGPVGHINGNMLMSPMIARYVPKFYGCPATSAWDCFFAEDFAPRWRKADFMENLYHQAAPSRKELELMVARGSVLIHGVKDTTVEEFADSVLRK